MTYRTARGDALCLPVRFDVHDANRCGAAWGANCGALAAVTGLTLDDVHPHIRWFDERRYTNPTMMVSALRSIGARFTAVVDPNGLTNIWPLHGLVRIQWEGPWTSPGVPRRARYRYSHWVGSRHTDEGVDVFDINCMCVGGWVSFEEWREAVVPWLLQHCHPRANGRWHATHAYEVTVGAAERRSA